MDVGPTGDKTSSGHPSAGRRRGWPPPGPCSKSVASAPRSEEEISASATSASATSASAPAAFAAPLAALAAAAASAAELVARRGYRVAAELMASVPRRKEGARRASRDAARKSALNSPRHVLA